MSFLGTFNLNVVRCVLFVLGVVATAASTHGQSKTWTGAVSSAWNNAGNWSPTGVPGVNDTVLIPPGPGVVTSSGGVLVASVDIRRPITISGLFSASTTLSSSMTLGGTLSGTLAVLPGGSISGSVCNGRLADLAITTDIPTLNGSVRWNNVSNAGTITMRSGSQIAFEGTQTFTGSINATATAAAPAFLTAYFAGASEVTIASGAQIRGSGLIVRTNANGALVCGHPTALQSFVNYGNIEGTSAANPIVFQPSVVAGTWNVAGAVRLEGSLMNGTVNVATTAAGTPELKSEDCADRLSNVTINGSFAPFLGTVFWNNVTNNGTMTLRWPAEIIFEGSQTITGTFNVEASANLAVYFSQRLEGLSVITVAEGAVISGAGLIFRRSSRSCGVSSGVQILVNNGLLNSTDPNNPFELNCPISHGTGTFLGSSRFFRGGYSNGEIRVSSGQSLILSGIVENTQIVAEPGSSVKLGGGCGQQLTNVTITGDVEIFGGVRWNNVINNGTITVKSDSEIHFEGDQTITGTIVAISDSSGSPKFTSSLKADGVSPSILTIASGAKVQGNGFLIGNKFVGSSGCAFYNVVQQVVLNGTIEGPGRIGSEIVGGTGSIVGTVQLEGSVSNSDLLALPNSGGTPSLFSFCDVRLSNATINGEVEIEGRVRCSNLVNRGTIRLRRGASLNFEGSQTLTGTVEAAGSYPFPRCYIGIVGTEPAVLTIASGASVRGSNLYLGAGGTGCSNITTYRIVNNGTIESMDASYPLMVASPIIGGSGRLVGNVSLQSEIRDCVITFEPSVVGFPTFSDVRPCRVTNATFNGVADVKGEVIWDRVTNNGKLRLLSSSSIGFEGSQTLTGTFESLSTESVLGPYLFQRQPGQTVLTVAPGCRIGGGRVRINGAFNSSTHQARLVNNGIIESNNPASPVKLSFALGGGTGEFRGALDAALLDVLDADLRFSAGQTVSVKGSMTNSKLYVAPGCKLNLYGDCRTRFSNVVITGDVEQQSGILRWNNVVLNGTLRMFGSVRIAFEGDQTITGTIIVEPVPGTEVPASFTQLNSTPGVLTIAPGAVVQASALTMYSEVSSPLLCSGAGRSSVVNRGSIIGTDPLKPVVIQGPMVNLGTISGAVELSGQTFGEDWTSATATQPAVVRSSRNDPGAASTQTLNFQDMYLAPNVAFTLGENETLNLNSGAGTLFIPPGAVFTANGVVNGKINNAGTLIVPPTRASIISSVRGSGTVQIVPPTILPPPGIPVDVALGAPPVVQSGTLVRIGTGGGETYRLTSSGITLNGGLVWDGLLEVTGSFTQTTTGVMRLFIAGNIQGETYSQLKVGQGATLAGGLQIVLEPDLLGFVPSVGDTFDMVYAEGGLTIDPAGLAITSLMTRAGAQQLGLSLPTFNSGYAGDPNSLVQLPSNIFSYQLLPDGKTLRITLTAPVCGTTLSIGGSFVCPSTPASFTANTAGSGPFTYVWSYRGRNGQPPADWTVITEGANTPGGVGSGVAFSAVGATGRTLTLTRTGGSWPLFGNGSAGEVRCEIVGPCGPATVTGLFGVVGSKCLPADLARDDGTFLPPFGPCDTQFPNAGINEGDYNAFFAADGFFYQSALGPAAVGMSCDIADDQGVALPPFDTGGTTAANNGVNEGDYNVFFNTLFLPCP